MKMILNIIFKVFKKIIAYLGISVFVIFIIYTLYAIPAMLSLPGGVRTGIKAQTIDEAVQALKKKDLDGRELIEEARSLVGKRMAYCRRNSYESYKKALLEDLNFDAVPVQAMQTRFPDGNIGGHAWVRVKVNEAYLFIDPIFYNPENQEITFSPVSEVTEFSPFFRILSGWGSATINAHRYYTTGSD